jgi:hypothetical protein
MELPIICTLPLPEEDPNCLLSTNASAALDYLFQLQCAVLALFSLKLDSSDEFQRFLVLMLIDAIE